MPCAFCTDPDIPDRTIVASELAFAFPTNTPIVPGHILIVPKRHVQYYEGLTAEERAAIEALRDALKKALVSTMGAEGFNYAWNEEVIGGQSVPHFHLHIVPRKEGDAGIYEYEPRAFLYRPGSRAQSPEQELRDVADLIRSAL